ncbi:restriction endonuclease subunit S [Sphingobacterium sp. JB170]|uniref:restriction endonuclease subunit S n=1 Tax=Sphingobacterium sp. JB170 TaxID=1434842 RepID=UPI00117B1F28|nr:restriction endonuclease subunit S [Sphingobacterium sp. JB170]
MIKELDFITYAKADFDYTVYISGAAQPKLTKENVMNILLIVPSLPKQEAIVLYLDEVTTKIDQAITQKQIIQLKEYKQSLINNVVTGKVRVAS